MTVVAAPASPYKGLAPFDDSDADALLFFGRDRDSQIIAANLVASSLTVLFGPTGVGKTSILRAGVAHRLRREAGVDVVMQSAWTSDPVLALRRALDRAMGEEVFLVLDQFEEYFLYHDGDATFVEELAEVTRRVNVLIGIREDALARLDAFKATLPNLLSNRLRLDHLDREGAREAILGPTRRYNVLVTEDRRIDIEDALVSTVLDEVATGRVDLGAAGRGGVDAPQTPDRIEAPYLQLVMSRLWEVETDRGSRVLQVETLRELGGSSRIVEDHLEHAMAELSPREKDAAAAMYNFLVTPTGTKIAHRVRDLAGYADITAEEADSVLRALAAERIVRASSENGAGTRYEIYHDVLADAVTAWRTRHGAERALETAERKRRRAFAVATASLVALILVAAIAVFALVQRSRSAAEARRAHARELAAAAVSRLDTDPRKGLELALQAARLERGDVEEDALRRALLTDNQRVVLRAGGPVRTIAFDPTRGRIATGANDGRVRVYAIGSTVPERVFNQGGAVTAATYGPTGLLLTAGRDGSATLWRPTGAARLDTEAPVTSASFGRSGRLVLTTSENGRIQLWRTRDGRLLRTIRVGGKAVPLHGVLDPSGRLVATVGHDRFARMYSVDTGRLVHRLPQQALVHCAAFNPDGSKLVTCGHEGVVRVWTRDGGLVRRLSGPAKGQAILAAAFSPDGKLVVAAVHDGTARLWNVATGELIATMFGHSNALTSVTFSPDGKAIATGGLDNVARTWLPTGRPERLFSGHTRPINAVAFSPDGRFLATAGEDGTARVWESATGPELTVIARHSGLTALAEGDGGRRIAIGDKRGTVEVHSVDGSRVSAEKVGRPITGVAFGANGARAVTSPELSIAISRDGDVARGTGNGTVLLTDSPGRSRMLDSSGAVTAVAFSPDRSLLAAGSSAGSVTLWDTRSGERKKRFVAHKLAVTTVRFSPDGKLLLTAGRDHEARLWDVKTARLLHILGLHFGPVFGASFSPDGQWVVTAGCCGASVIQASTGQRWQILRGHSKPLIGAEFAGADGHLIVTAARDGTVRSYRCVFCGNVDDLIAAAERRLRQG
jgi:WD40 repeat protein